MYLSRLGSMNIRSAVAALVGSSWSPWRVILSLGYAVADIRALVQRIADIADPSERDKLLLSDQVASRGPKPGLGVMIEGKLVSTNHLYCNNLSTGQRARHERFMSQRMPALNAIDRRHGAPARRPGARGSERGRLARDRGPRGHCHHARVAAARQLLWPAHQRPVRRALQRASPSSRTLRAPFASRSSACRRRPCTRSRRKPPRPSPSSRPCKRRCSRSSSAASPSACLWQVLPGRRQRWPLLLASFELTLHISRSHWQPLPPFPLLSPYPPTCTSPLPRCRCLHADACMQMHAEHCKHANACT